MRESALASPAPRQQWRATHPSSTQPHRCQLQPRTYGFRPQTPRTSQGRCLGERPRRAQTTNSCCPYPAGRWPLYLRQSAARQQSLAHSKSAAERASTCVAGPAAAVTRNSPQQYAAPPLPAAIAHVCSTPASSEDQPPLTPTGSLTGTGTVVHVGSGGQSQNKRFSSIGMQNRCQMECSSSSHRTVSTICARLRETHYHIYHSNMLWYNPSPYMEDWALDRSETKSPLYDQNLLYHPSPIPPPAPAPRPHPAGRSSHHLRQCAARQHSLAHSKSAA